MKTTKIATLLFLSVFTSTAWSDATPEQKTAGSPAAADSPARSEPAPADQRIAALGREQTPDTKVIWLKTAQESRLALYQPTSSTQSHGGILIFHDRETSPDWPEIVRPLRTQLTLHGWSTLSVSLPDPVAATLPDRTLAAVETDSTPNSPSPEAASASPSATESTVQPMEATSQAHPKESYLAIFSRIARAASKQLSAKNHHRQVVIGIGDGALWSAAYVLQNQQAQDLRLVMINPSQPADRQAPKLLDLIPKLSGTTLDLYFSASRQQVEEAKLRKHTAARHQLSNYKQFLINQRPDDPKRVQQWLTRQVRGLLQTYIVKADTQKTTARPATPSSQLAPGS